MDQTSITDDLTISHISVIATTPQIKVSKDSNPTRGRRTITESDYSIVDLDVTTPELKILEEGFGISASFMSKSLSYFCI
ncbi:unnamed protein product [Thelazia callipaeda]|uniref:Transposase n=1 Tax=Thelazia callipaeda TaxID=103827 RepID=A0A0N5CQ41_THECL|nr:unnamed protein product [Thelazia callipaeda]